MELPDKLSKHNFRAFLWHAAFLALAQNFMDVDTIIPAMLIEAGGNAFHIGLMTAIMLGGSSFTQLFFAPYVSRRPYKKNILLTGINSRIISLLALGIILFTFRQHSSRIILLLIFALITMFSLGGAFANIAYIDIAGKSMMTGQRKKFFSSRQIISGIAVLGSAFLAKWLLTLSSYPVNYARSFIIGSILLLIASIGFWKIREPIASDFSMGSISNLLRVLKEEIRVNKRLVYFLGFINTQGIAIAFLPFVVLYAKEMMHAGSMQTGSFLLNKIIGMVFVSLLVLLFSRRIKYRIILYLNVALILILATSVLLIDSLAHLHYVFILGGIIFSLYNISMNGVLLEISGNKNRALYAGFSGAGNLFPAVFPLVAGWIIQEWGFTVFFLLFMTVVASSLFFIYKMDCLK